MNTINSHSISFLLLVSLFVNLALSSCQQREYKEVDIYFSAEKPTEDGKDLYAENDSSIIFKGAHFRTNSTSHSGDYSYITSPKNKYALGLNIQNVKPDSYVEISIWRKGKSVKSLLITSSTTPDFFYKTTNEVIKHENGWEQLQLEFFIPPNYIDDVLKIYVWNNSNDTIFFDDLSISIKFAKGFPSYKEKAIYLEIDTTEYLKIMDIRRKAFDVGILQTEDDDWVKAFVFGDGKMMKTKLRLKGDWLDHLHGDKWSFRLKLRNGNTWEQIRTLSLHNPVARYGVDEWFLHKILQSQDVLTTRYGFVPVYLNNKNLGLYAWEEHFSKQLIESQNKREGPILRFFEDVLWDKVRGKKSGIDSIQLPFFEAAVIKPFSPTKIIEDTVAYEQYLIAQNLMLQYKLRKKTASEIFNIDALAKYFALNDVLSAYHSIIWHNQRFYYNPVLCKLEPIAFDAYTETGPFDWISDRSFYGNITFNSIKLLDDQFLMIRELFNDYCFLEVYVKYLEKYSSLEFLTDVSNQYKDEANFYDSLVQIEFPDLKLNIPEIYKNASNIRNDLPAFKAQLAERKKENISWLNISKTEKEFTKGLEGNYARNLVIAYSMKKGNDSTLIKVINYFSDPVLLLGTGKTKQKIRDFIHPEPELKGYQFDNPETYEFWTSQPSNYLFFLTGDNETISAEIYQWPEPNEEDTPLQELVVKNSFSDSDLMDVSNDGKIVFKNGNLTLNKPLIIPSGYKVFLEKGTKIDLIDSAMIISYSPLFMNGTADQPILITSSDFTGCGLTILQAETRSKISYARFENLNTLDYKGWTLTGAITFYESDVDISNTLFYRNQCEDALNTIRSDFKLEKSTFDHIYGDAFDSDFCTGLVNNCKFNNIGNDAIDFSGSQIQIVDTEIIEAKDKGISGGENSYLIVENTTILRSNIGLASKDLSTVDVINSSVIDCNYGIVLLQKKPEYGPATMTLTNTSINNAKTKHLIEIGSEAAIDGVKIKGNRKDLADVFY